MDGVEVQWEKKAILEVEKDQSRTAHLGEVTVRRTARLRGDKAGRRGDQARIEDLSKPLLILCPPCGHLQSISADISMGGHQDDQTYKPENWSLLLLLQCD